MWIREPSRDLLCTLHLFLFFAHEWYEWYEFFAHEPFALTLATKEATNTVDVAAPASNARKPSPKQVSLTLQITAICDYCKLKGFEGL
jgi:hypothetical protein